MSTRLGPTNVSIKSRLTSGICTTGYIGFGSLGNSQLVIDILATLNGMLRFRVVVQFSGQQKGPLECQQTVVGTYNCVPSFRFNLLTTPCRIDHVNRIQTYTIYPLENSKWVFHALEELYWRYLVGLVTVTGLSRCVAKACFATTPTKLNLFSNQKDNPVENINLHTC